MKLMFYYIEGFDLLWKPVCCSVFTNTHHWKVSWKTGGWRWNRCSFWRSRLLCYLLENKTFKALKRINLFSTLHAKPDSKPAAKTLNIRLFQHALNQEPKSSTCVYAPDVLLRAQLRDNAYFCRLIFSICKERIDLPFSF